MATNRIHRWLPPTLQQRLTGCCQPVMSVGPASTGAFVTLSWSSTTPAQAEIYARALQAAQRQVARQSLLRTWVGRAN